MPDHIEWIVTTPVTPAPDRCAPPRDATRRALAAREDDLPGDVARDLRVEREGRAGRVAELRQRARDGAYDSSAVLEQVARRILESGDL
jgi:hypothetical protein